MLSIFFVIMINFKIEKFEGPLSLLVKMIDKEEMDITQISLAHIADQYISYIKTSNNISPDEMADFLVVAARLLLIKSRALLPFIYPEEEKEIEELENQLRMYKEFLEAAKEIEKMLKKKKFMFTREFNRKIILSSISANGGISLFSPPTSLKAKDLKTVFKDILSRLHPPEKIEEQRMDERIKIEDKIKRIHNILINKIKTSFSKVVDGAKSKTEVIVSFLAILELIKQHDIAVSQSGLFNEIYINKKS